MTRMPKRLYSPIVLMKSLDADFDTVMKSVAFSTTPREVVTIEDMQELHAKVEFFENIVGVNYAQ